MGRLFLEGGGGVLIALMHTHLTRVIEMAYTQHCWARIGLTPLPSAMGQGEDKIEGG